MLYRLKGETLFIKVISQSGSIINCIKDETKKKFDLQKISEVNEQNHIFAYFDSNNLNIYDNSVDGVIGKIEKIDIDTVSSLTISSQNQYLALGLFNGRLIVYSLIGFKEVMNIDIFKGEPIESIAFGDDGIVVLISQKRLMTISLINKKVLFKKLENSVLKQLGVVDNHLFFSISNTIYKYEIGSKSDTEILKTVDSISKIISANGYLIGLARDTIYFINENPYSIKSKMPREKDIVDIAWCQKREKLFALRKNGTLDALNIAKYLEIKSKSKESESNEDKLKFLIVDDSNTMRMIIKQTIANNFDNILFFEAADGKEAMREMEKHPDMDVMFLDWNMPNMTGQEVVDAVRANKEWMKTRIIMATTEGSKANVLKMIKKGANGYMVKPFQEDAIFKTLDTITARMPKE